MATLKSKDAQNGRIQDPARAPGANKKYPFISAKYKGPGPGKYSRQPCTGIKDHDFTKYTEPAYTMRVKSSEKLISVEESPGPCYYVDPSVSRLGMWRPISFRMTTERKKMQPSETPAPNEYYVEKIHPVDERCAPAYTIGKMTYYWVASPHPAPNSYNLPGTLGPRLPTNASAPAYSMSSNACAWGYAKDLVRGPGPAQHARPEPSVYLNRQPSYSMGHRLDPSCKDYTPGPPDYDNDKVTIHKPRAPRFSLGIRHSDYITSTPTMCIIKD
ncbi:hypothetical protein lerEdw1_008391 [Lerista edwardsae]|nr:hypothetical protein lerEdw1_008391 [Lerista edwardsae]